MEQQNVTVDPSTKFLVDRDRMKPQDANMSRKYENFVQYSDDGYFGYYVFYLEPIPGKIYFGAGDEYEIILNARDNDKVKVTVYEYNEYFFNSFKLRLNIVSSSIREHHVLKNLVADRNLPMEIMGYSLVAKHLNKMRNNYSICNKMFPRGVISNLDDYRLWCSAIDKVLCRTLSNDTAALIKNKFLIRKEHTTIGDFIVCMFMRRQESFENVNINTKLMLLALCCLGYFKDDILIVNRVLIAMYNWIALNTCDSCFEVILRDIFMDDSENIDLSYEYSNYSNTKLRILEFKIDFDYKIFDCFKDPKDNKRLMQASASIIKVYSHSALVVRRIGSVVTINLNNRPIILTYYRGASLYRAVNLITSVIKDMHFTHDYDLLAKRLLRLDMDGLSCNYERSIVDDIIIDLFEIYYISLNNGDNDLSRIVTRIIFMLFYAIVPYQVMKNFILTQDDAYASALDAVVRANWLAFKTEMFDSMLVNINDRQYIEKMLKMRGRKIIIGNLC